MLRNVKTTSTQIVTNVRLTCTQIVTNVALSVATDVCAMGVDTVAICHIPCFNRQLKQKIQFYMSASRKFYYSFRQVKKEYFNRQVKKEI